MLGSKKHKKVYAEVAELVDAPGLGPGESNLMRVQVSPSAQKHPH